ncbi:MAG: bifunctional 4-hydroxy-2-oxoglutarate aldolase/2-dehydro-3-deoxy-phosphogluconate aldolase [Candidatus Marinimicrobia bacterium]|nr:bifunctional 4-hydroxy-2-oxoglutarate aldolase/2-dehydro-3-deoxy-phosphogluconate aldolase [Candidatus Neomarinimicrobiota bacterium]
MTRIQVLNNMIETGVIAVIRITDPQILKPLSEALVAGGVKCLEITMTTPKALELILEATEHNCHEMTIGVGSVLDPITAREAILAGAQFVVSPILDLDVIHISHQYDKTVISGAMTPTEIMKAWREGADLVKVFPATALGPKFFKDIKGPMPQVRLTPTGGVNLNNTADFICAGAECIGVGSALLDKQMIEKKDWEGIEKNARAFCEQVKIGREQCGKKK